MPYDDVANYGTVTKTNRIDKMPCIYGTLTTTAVKIRHQYSHSAAQCCAEVSANLKVSCRSAQRSQLLQHRTSLYDIYRIILNAPP